MKRVFEILIEGFAFLSVLFFGIAAILMVLGPIALALDRHSAYWLLLYIPSIPLLSLSLRAAARMALLGLK